jgi:hypothetical protein
MLGQSHLFRKKLQVFSLQVFQELVAFFSWQDVQNPPELLSFFERKTMDFPHTPFGQEIHV